MLLNGTDAPCPLAAPVRDLLTARRLASLPPYGIALVQRR
jgi:hypothetical protein